MCFSFQKALSNLVAESVVGRHILLMLATGLVTLASTPLRAQTTQSGSITLPGSSGESGAPGQTCVQVRIAGETASPYNCLNQELQQQVQGSGAPQPSLPLGPASPSNQIGTFNEQSVSEQYGKNFGKSVIPYRPPPPVFSNFMGGTR